MLRFSDQPRRLVSTYSLRRFDLTCFVEEAVLLGRLRPVETNYHLDSRCMDGTREFLLQEVTGWATKQPGQNKSNIYWISGLPGIGKTSLAHSICARLEEK